MTYDNYRNQGQQDDYFDADISRAGDSEALLRQRSEALGVSADRPKQDSDYGDYREQGQQNDHFDADLSS